MLKTLRSALDMARGPAGLAEVMKRPIRTLKALKGISLRRFLQQIAHQNDLALGVSVQLAEARGTVTTVSPDPHVQPVIDYNYLDNELDLRRMREVVRAAVAILRSNAFRPYVKRLGELDDRTIGDDARLNGWLREHLSTAIHASGSCKMGPDPAQGAVVDQYGRVHGVSGLRVADSSILPTTPSRGPAATTIMVGMRMAELIGRSDIAADVSVPGRS
jgi:choline dehydrogenase-like flavoprotein